MSTPLFDPDDPRLTAYALGEAEPVDRQAVEKILSESAEARAEVERTRALGDTLKAEYAREHALYLASRPAIAAPTNIVEFRSGWRRAGLLGLKAAAVLTVAASLVYLTLRESRHPENRAVASATPDEPVRAPAPAPALDESATKDQSAAGSDATVSANSRAEPAAQPPAATPVGPQLAQTTTAPADALMANNKQAPASQTQRDFRVAFAESPPAPGAASASSLADAPTVLPETSGVTSTAVARPESFNAAEERFARSMVRVRTASGDFFGGVIVSGDGLLLAAASLPADAMRPPYMASLADKRELPATLQTRAAGPGWLCLRIDATALPTVALARDAPANNESLAVAFISRQTGAATFAHVQAARTKPQDRKTQISLENSSKTDGEAVFAFNAAGELLLLEPPQQSLYATRNAATAKAGAAPAQRTVRPFTASERTLLEQAGGRERHQ